MSNTLTNVLPTILADGVSALRQNAVMSRLVTRDYQQLAQEKGNVVTVPIPSAIPARAVTPANAFAANQDSSPTAATIQLNQWYESPLNLSDSDSAATRPNFMTMQATEAVKSLINTIDISIINSHTGFFSYTGTQGTTPFNGSINAAATAKKLLSINLAPVDGRNLVIDPLAEANALVVPEVLRYDGRGNSDGIVKGQIGTILGMTWVMDQNVPTYTPGGGWVTGFAVSTTTAVKGGFTLHILNATASGTINVGDLFSMSDGTQYVVTATATASATVGIDIKVYPALTSSYAVAATLAVVGSTAYTVNLAFHPTAIAFASRPLSGVFQAGNIFQAPVDDVSGIALRLELSRQYKQETLSFDALWGTNWVRRELGVKIFG